METVAGASSMLEMSRDLTLDAVQAAAARTFGSSQPKEASMTHIKQLLDSKFDKEIHEGLRKVINMMYRGHQCLPLFSAVIKNVASPNVEIKKLVYIYLIQYAEQEPDMALLSINTIQKSLSDQNPQVRAMALRVMSGIQVPIISQIVSLAIKKGCGDMSAMVRKTAALAIPKCYKLEPSTEPQLVDYISQLLGDKQYFVVGSAIIAFLEVCPERIDLLHKHYRGLVKKLVDMDEWGQLALIKLLTIYARKCFLRPGTARKDSTPQNGNESQEESTEASPALDPDLKLFLNACQKLLSNRNPAVILALVRAFLYVGTEEYLQTAIQPMIALLRGPKDYRSVILYNIVPICLEYPSYFAPFIDHFWIWTTDDSVVRRLKMEILTLIFPHCDGKGKGLILNELEHFTSSSDPELIRESVRAIGRCAQNDKSTVSWCMNLLLQQASSSDENLVGEALTVVRRLIQQDPAAYRKTIIRLAKNLDTIYNIEARATIVWLVGEYAAGTDEPDSIAPDVLRILSRGFSKEAVTVKSQIVLLAAKVYLHHMNKITPDKDVPGREENDEATQNASEQVSEEPKEEIDVKNDEHPITALWDYIQLLVRYDTSYELRDRTRLYKNLLSDAATLQLANLMLLAPKQVPQVPSPSETRKNLLLASSTLIIGQDAGPSGLSGYEDLPDWVDPDQIPDPSLRDVGLPQESIQAKPTAAAMLDSALEDKGTDTVARPKVPTKTLNDWLDESDESDAGTGAVTVSAKGKAPVSSSEEEDSDEDEDEDDDDSESDDDDSEDTSD